MISRRLLAPLLLVAVLPACAGSRAAGPGAGPAPQPLFNGKDLSGWDGDERHWAVQDGLITGTTSAETTGDRPTYLIWRGGTVGDFELRVVYRLVGPGNSGVQYRSRDVGDLLVHGYQADFETSHDQKWTGALVEMGGRLHLGLRGEKTVVGADGKPQVVARLGDPDALAAHLSPDGWNELLIVARGHRLVHVINGHTMVEVSDEDPARRALDGIVALQVSRHRPMTVQFRTVELRRL